MFQRNASPVSGLRKLVLVAAACLPMTLNGFTARAQSIAPDPANPVPARAATDGTLTDQSLGTLLNKMGLGANSITDNDQTYYTVPLHYQGYTIQAHIFLSPSKSYLWIECSVSDKISPDKVDKAMLLKLMEMNADGPASFKYDADNNQFCAQISVHNANLTSAELGVALSNFCAEAVNSQKVFTPSPAPAPTPAPAPAPATGGNPYQN